jgi:hypothetical protein
VLLHFVQHFFSVVVAVQSEETKNYYAGSDAKESGIPALQPASFATD